MFSGFGENGKLTLFFFISIDDKIQNFLQNITHVKPFMIYVQSIRL